MAANGLTRRNSSHVAEAYVPPSAWTDDPNGRYLLIDLPGFKKEEVRLEVASTGRIIISGERLVGTDKCVFFEQDFPLPEDADADADNISGKFDGELLYISVPKKQPVKSADHEKGNEYHHEITSVGHDSTAHESSASSSDDDDDGEDHEEEFVKRKTERPPPVGGGINGGPVVAGLPPEILKKWAKEKGQLGEAIKLVKDNKGMVVALLVAFSLGFYLSQKLGTTTTTTAT